MNPDDLQQLWKSAGDTVPGDDWTAARIEALRWKRSGSVAAYLGRLLAADQVFKAVAAAGFVIAAWLSRGDVAGVITALGGLLGTLGLAVPATRARRVFSHGRGLAGDVCTVTRTLLADLAGFRRAALPAVAASGSLMLLAWLVGYFAVEYGGLRALRPAQWGISAVLLATPFLARVAVVGSRLRASTTALTACLGELDPDALAVIGLEDRRARRILLAALLVVAGLLGLGVAVYLAG
jgi:hypothetical protein